MLGNCCNQKITAPRTLMSEKSPLDPQPSQGFNGAMGLQLGYVFPQNEVIAELIAHTTLASRLSSKVLDTNQSHRLRAIRNTEGAVFLNLGPTSADRKTPLFFRKLNKCLPKRKHEKSWQFSIIIHLTILMSKADDRTQRIPPARGLRKKIMADIVHTIPTSTVSTMNLSTLPFSNLFSALPP